MNMGSGIQTVDITIRNRNVLERRFKEDEDDVVSLDPPPKIILDHWDINVVKMFSEKKQALLSSKILMDIVASYKLSLRNKALFYAYSERFSSCILQHLSYIHECYHDMEYHRISLPDIANYYALLEDVIAIYCTVEMKKISKICFKPDSNNNRECGMSVMTDEKMYLIRLAKHAQKMAFILQNFLHHNENVLHVLMKMWYNKASPSCVKTMENLYILVLHETPITDTSDESYCRYVINYLSWLLIRDEDNREGMLRVLNSKFKYDNHEIENSKFIKKVFNTPGDPLISMNLIQLKSTTIERYFNEFKKCQQRRMFHDDSIGNTRPFESFLFDVNDDMDINNGDAHSELDLNFDSDESSDVVEIITLDSDEDDDIQIISNKSGNTKSTKAQQRDIKPPMTLTTPLIPASVKTTSSTVDTITASQKVQTALYHTPHWRKPLLDSNTNSVLQTITEVTRKPPPGTSEQSVSNRGSVTELCSDISERFAAKRAQVKSRGRPSVDASHMSENPYMSPPSSSIGTPDNNYTEAVELDAHSPKCATNVGIGGAHGTTNVRHNGANLLLYTPDSQDERTDESFELQPRTPTDGEDRDVNSGPDEDHDTGQEQKKRREIPQPDISPTNPKRRKVNGDVASILLSPVSLNANKEDADDSKSTTKTGILFTASVSKRRRTNSDEDTSPWERDPLEQHTDDTCADLNDDPLKNDTKSNTSTKSPPQSTTVPDYKSPVTPLRKTLGSIIIVPQPVDLNEPIFTTENGVKGLLGSDVALLEQKPVIVEAVEEMCVGTEETHTAFVRNKAHVQIVRQTVNDNVEKMTSALRIKARSRGQIEVDTEDGDGRRMNATGSKDILKEACADLLLPDADQDETIGTTSSNLINSVAHIAVLTSELTNSDAGAISPASGPGTSYRLQDFNSFEEKHKDSLSAASSYAGSIHDEERLTLPNGFVTPNCDADDRISVHSFGSYQAEEPQDGENIVTTSPTTTTAKEKHINFKGISAHVSSSSSDPSCNTAGSKDQPYLPHGTQSLRKYINSSITFVDLTCRKQWNPKCKLPEMGRKRPLHARDYSFLNSSPSVHISEVFHDDPNMCGRLGLNLRQIPIASNRPTIPTKEPLTILKKTSRPMSPNFEVTNSRKRKYAADVKVQFDTSVRRKR